MTLFKGPPGFRPEDRAEREAYEQRSLDKMANLMIDADNKRVVAEKRAAELVVELMKSQADLSTARTENAALRGHVEQAYRDFEGHNHCWRNIERLFEQFGLAPKRRALPPYEEAMVGCAAFWKAAEKEPGRWPDFVDPPKEPHEPNDT